MYLSNKNFTRWFPAIKKLPALVLLVAFYSNPSALCGTSSGNDRGYSENLQRNEVFLYYFYFVPRCDECIILETALLKMLQDFYHDEVNDGDLIFKKINLSDPDPESEQLIKKLRVRRQLLLLVRDDTTENLTRDAFRFVERDYERFRILMKEAIDRALSQ